MLNEKKITVYDQKGKKELGPLQIHINILFQEMMQMQRDNQILTVLMGALSFCKVNQTKNPNKLNFKENVSFLFHDDNKCV